MHCTNSLSDNEQDYIASSPQESISLALPMEENPLVLGLQWAAKQSKMAINVGIHVPANNGKILNRSCWINEHGHIVSFYDKLHLFDYGALKESNSVEAGKNIVPPVDTVVGRVGLTICFDVSNLSVCWNILPADIK
jgi:predicted amidohydrolase